MREPPVYLVRHAKAGDRQAWTEDDRLRPLSKKGRRQAEALVGAFGGLGVGRVLSSPYVRCEQTVRPLALDRGLSLDLTEALAEGAPLEGLLEIIADLDDVALVAVRLHRQDVPRPAEAGPERVPPNVPDEP